MHDLTAALVQTSLHWADSRRNLEMFTVKLEGISGADLVILPEMFNTGFITEPEDVAEEMEGPSMRWMSEMSSQKNFVLAGSLIIREEGRYYNRLVWMPPDGRYSYYDKRHLFRMAGEHEKFTMGMERLIVELKGWKIFPQVCYDLRFPVWSMNRLIDGRHEFDLLIYLANWPEARSQAWKLLLAARSVDNQCYTIGVNRVGTDGKGIVYSGDSSAVDPRGKVIQQAMPGSESIMMARLDRKELQDFRESFRVGLDWDPFTITDP